MPPTCTAQIIVGPSMDGWGQPNRGIGPIWAMYLIEGARAAWCLEPIVHGDPAREPTDPVTMVAGAPQFILADALVMIAVRIEDNDELRQTIKSHLPAKFAHALLEEPWSDLDQIATKADLSPIRELAQQVVRLKLVVTTMDGSSVTGQLGLLARCSMDAEVCVAGWSRRQGEDGPSVAGTLPPEDPEAHAFYELR